VNCDRWPSKAFGTAVAVAILVAASATTSLGDSSRYYYWTISGSQFDPLVQTGSPSGGLDTLYIWIVCSNPSFDEGMSAAEFGLEGTLTPLGLTPSEGFLNVGTVASPMLAAANCPPGPTLVASILIEHEVGGSLCFGPSINGYNGTVDCTPNPALWPNFYQGYSSLGSPCDNLCLSWMSCSCTSSVDSQSWGSLKSLYR